MVMMYVAWGFGCISGSEAVSNPAKDRIFLHAALAVVGISVLMLTACFVALLLSGMFGSLILIAAISAIPALAYVAIIYLVLSMSSAWGSAV